MDNSDLSVFSRGGNHVISFNNKNINDKNAEIAKLADNNTVFYIDVNEAVCDAKGNLNEEYTIDEVHLKAKYYGIWKQFLLEHGIVR